jgi:seryl-tRNA synthetase
VKQVYQYKSLSSVCRVLRNEVPEQELDIDYLCNDKYKSEIEENIKRRKGIGNIGRVHELHSELKNSGLSEENKADLVKEFKEELKLIPNKTCPLVALYGDNPKVVKVIGNKRTFDFQPKEFSDITKMLQLMRTDNLSNLSGHKSYYLMGELAEMEHALVWFTVKKLLERKFQFISVPDILPAHILESCGMSTRGDRTQVYGTVCLTSSKRWCQIPLENWLPKGTFQFCQFLKANTPTVFLQYFFICCILFFQTLLVPQNVKNWQYTNISNISR